MKLDHLQRALQQHVIDGDDAVAAVINESEAVCAAARLDVYSDAYRLRLVDALAQNFPRLQQLLGTEAFAEAARGYLRAHPSQNRSVRWFGDRLAAFLEVTYPHQPVLRELAQWEWAIAAAFDAASAVTLTEQELGTIEPEQWSSLRLQAHPSVQLLQMTTNAPAIFKALSNETAPPEPAALEQVQHWLIWRQDFTPRYRSISDDEAAALRSVVAQSTFEQICDALCEWHDPADVPARAVILLKGWLRDDMIVTALPAPSPE